MNQPLPGAVWIQSLSFLLSLASPPIETSKSSSPHILHTKLYRPPPTPGLEQRTRLLDRLNRNIQQPLTLIKAPAGYGKTVLASQWLESREDTSTWLSLDESDHDLGSLILVLGVIPNYFINSSAPANYLGTVGQICRDIGGCKQIYSKCHTWYLLNESGKWVGAAASVLTQTRLIWIVAEFVYLVPVVLVCQKDYCDGYVTTYSDLG